MPELPEVETIKNDLESKIKSKTIANIEILSDKLINVPPKNFIKTVKGTTITNISRRAKILIVTLSNNFALLMHLKLTGQLLYESRIKNHELRIILKDPRYKHTRCVFFFKEGGALIFNDMRGFGYIKLMPQDKIESMIGAEKLGPEPLSPDFTLEKFKNILLKYPRRKIKQMLMDQEIIAGIGNIYSDEICFYAKVLPTKQVKDLSEKQIKNLYKGIRTILPLAIKLRGSSIDTYVDASGKKGSFAKVMKVYGREGEKCFGCPGKVKRIKLGGRSAHFCPSCQG